MTRKFNTLGAVTDKYCTVDLLLVTFASKIDSKSHGNAGPFGHLRLVATWGPGGNQKQIFHLNFHPAIGWWHGVLTLELQESSWNSRANSYVGGTMAHPESFNLWPQMHHTCVVK